MKIGQSKVKTYIECEFCHKDVTVLPKLVEKITWQNKRRDIDLYITTFRCPNCGNLSVRYIDDKTNQSLLKMLLKLKLKGETLRTKGQCLNGADKKKMAMLDRKLNHRRCELFKEFGPDVDQFIIKLESNEPSREEILEKKEEQ